MLIVHVLLLLLLLLLQGDKVLINGPLVVRIGLRGHGGLSQSAKMGAQMSTAVLVATQCQVFIE